ncbi:MAG TPA: hypothetical protein VG826_05970, partial [Pirellulales bacterium]|nr:hypothetical protein [Pirellulales bacterium]
MALLRELFGPSKDEIWRQLCEQISGDFVEGGLWKGSKVQVHHKQWTVTLDTYTESQGENNATYTRMRAPFVNKDGFRFTIYRRGVAVHRAVKNWSSRNRRFGRHLGYVARWDYRGTDRPADAGGTGYHSA